MSLTALSEVRQAKIYAWIGFFSSHIRCSDCGNRFTGSCLLASRFQPNRTSRTNTAEIVIKACPDCAQRNHSDQLIKIQDRFRAKS